MSTTAPNGAASLRWSPRLMLAGRPADPLPDGPLLPRPQTLDGLLDTLAAAAPAADQLAAAAPQPPPRRPGPRGSLPLHHVPANTTRQTTALLASILEALNMVAGWHAYRLDLEARATPFWSGTPQYPLRAPDLYTPLSQGFPLRPGPTYVDWEAPPAMPQTAAELAAWNVYYRLRAPYITDEPPPGYDADPWNAAAIDPGPVPQLLACRALAAAAPLASIHRLWRKALDTLTPYVVADVSAMVAELEAAMARLRDLYRNP